MRRQTTPIHIPAGGDTACKLERLDLGDSSQYDESWLQKLIHEWPTVLPIGEVEPAMADAIPVCRELPLRSGYLDNLLVTPLGDLVLVECKLWRNPEARRKVVAQILDYAKDLTRLDYVGLEAAVGKAPGNGGARLYDLVCQGAKSLPEPDFVDHVTRNLRRARALLMIAGDGITESVEELAEHLQQHVGLHFTLALVQLAVYASPDGGQLVVPSIPLRTTNVVRGIVRSGDGQFEIEAPPDTPQTRRPTTLTEEEFFAALDAQRARTSEALLALVSRGEDIGLFIEVKKMLLIKMPFGEGYSNNVLAISPDGNVHMGYAWPTGEMANQIFGSVRPYLERFANLIKGTIKSGKMPNVVMPGDQLPSIWQVLDYGEQWLDAVRSFREDVVKALEQ